MTKHILIENPAPGGARYTSGKCAARYVAKGRACWVRPGRIRFIESDHRHQSAYRLSVVGTDWGYDMRGRLLIKEIRHIPCLKPVELTTIPRKMRVSPPNRNGKVKVLVRAGEPVEEAA